MVTSKPLISEGLFLLKGADPKTFKILGYRYGCDKSNAYCLAKKMKNVDTKTFSILSDSDMYSSYAKDKKYVYCNGNRIKDATTGKIKYIGGSYAKDNKYVYWKGIKIKNICADTIQYIEDFRGGVNYIKDNKYVFYADSIISMNSESFELLRYYYMKDETNIYFFDGISHRIVKGADSNDFEQQDYYIISNNQVFLFGELTPFDADSFNVLVHANCEFTDRHGYPSMPYALTSDKNGYYINGIFIVSMEENESLKRQIEYLLSRLNLYEYATSYSLNPRTIKGIKSTGKIFSLD